MPFKKKTKRLRKHMRKLKKPENLLMEKFQTLKKRTEFTETYTATRARPQISQYNLQKPLKHW